MKKKKNVLDRSDTSVGGKLSKIITGIPVCIWLLVFVLIPLFVMLRYSFYIKTGSKIDRTVFTFGNYIRFFTDPIYIPVFVKTILYSLLIALISLLLGYPLAYFVSRKMTRGRNQAYMMVLVPLWVSYLVRIIAWRTILGRNGLINTFLMWTGIVKEPVSWLIYSPFAVVITLIHITLPFVFIPIFNGLEKIPKNLIFAAADLGADGRRTFLNVILPLSMPGVLSGFTMAFVIALGDYIIPKQLGGTTMLMMGGLIADQFGNAYNWPLGSSFGFILFTVAILILALTGNATKMEGDVE